MLDQDSTTRRRVIIGHPYMGRGGSEARVMWLIEALKEDCDVSVVTTGGWDLKALNSYYGTNVQEDKVRVRLAPVPYLLKHLEAAALRYFCYQRFARRIAGEYDLRISAYNLTDWGLPAVHFIADFSWSPELRASLDPPSPGFIYRNTGLRQAYLRLARGYGNLSGRNPLRQDTMIANSHWSANLVKRFYAVDCAEVIYPPVWTQFPNIPWEEKEPAFVMIGRIAPEKRIEQAIEILGAVRKRGYPVRLKLCGSMVNNYYGRQVARLCRKHDDWIDLCGSVQGAVKAGVLAHCRFGIQTRRAEPFGISVAEMIKAGALVFVPRDGGQTEIVGQSELLFSDTQDAVEKICAVMADTNKQKDLRSKLHERSAMFSAQHFAREARAAIDGCAVTQEPRSAITVRTGPTHRPRIIIGHPKLAFGGSESVVMWLIEALKRDFELSVVTTSGWNLDVLNQYYGTRVEREDVRIHIVPMPSLLTHFNSAALRGACYQRYARTIGSQYDVCISAYNITDWGKPAIHYLADFTWHPELRALFGPAPSRFIYRNTPARTAYLHMVNAIATSAATRHYSDDWLIANSHWTATMLEQHCGLDCARTIYPPVWEHFPAQPWAERDNAFVIIGRIAVEKRIEEAIEILHAVRRRGHAVTLHVCGETENDAYGKKVAQICRAHSEWVTQEGRVHGTKKEQILSHCRFGLHMRPAEPFGIAVAEMVSAGTLVFAPDSGGQTEILGTPELLFKDPEDAVEKICHVLSNPSSQEELRDRVRSHIGQFSAESFMKQSISTVDSFLGRTECMASDLRPDFSELH